MQYQVISSGLTSTGLNSILDKISHYFLGKDQYFGEIFQLWIKPHAERGTMKAEIY